MQREKKKYLSQSIYCISSTSLSSYNSFKVHVQEGRDSRKQIVIFRKVTTCFNFKDMFRCCQHHRQLQNI